MFTNCTTLYTIQNIIKSYGNLSHLSGERYVLLLKFLGFANGFGLINSSETCLVSKFSGISLDFTCDKTLIKPGI